MNVTARKHRPGGPTVSAMTQAHTSDSADRGHQSVCRGQGGSFTAMRDVSFDVAPGEFVTVVGPTGCGKSTTLSLDFRTGTGHRRRSRGRRNAGLRHSGIRRIHVPAGCRAAVADGLRQRRARSALPRRRQGGGARARPRVDRSRRVDRIRSVLPAPALRRYAQASGDGADADHRAGDHPDGRAVRRAGRTDAGTDAGRASAAVGRFEARRSSSSPTT